jgi:hypothetical protein
MVFKMIVGWEFDRETDQTSPPTLNRLGLI